MSVIRREINNKFWFALVSTIVIGASFIFEWINVSFLDFADGFSPITLYGNLDSLSGLYDSKVIRIFVITFLVLAAVSIFLLIISFTVYKFNAGAVLAYAGFGSSIGTHVIFIGFVLFLNSSVFNAYIVKYTLFPFIGLVVSVAAIILFIERPTVITGRDTSSRYDFESLLEYQPKKKSVWDVLRPIFGYPILLGVFAYIVNEMLFTGTNYFENMKMVWVIDSVTPAMGGPGQSFHLPQVAAFTFARADEPGFFSVAWMLIPTIIMPFIILLAGAVSSAIVCWICKIKQIKGIILFYGFCMLAVLVYLFANPDNYSGFNYMFMDLGFFNRIFALFTPLALGTLFFTAACSLVRMDSDDLIGYWVAIPIGYMLVTLVSAGVQNNLIGLKGFISDEGLFGYHFPWFRFILAGIGVSIIAMLPSALLSYIATEITDKVRSSMRRRRPI
jgi:hypothetical protein